MKGRLPAIGLALSALVVAGGLSCRYVMPERNIDYNAGRVPVNLPRDLKYAETDRDIDKSGTVIVSLPDNDQIFVGKERTATVKDDLRYKLKQLLQMQTEPEKIVYVAAAINNDYGTVVGVCDAIRMQDVSRVGLLGNRTGMNMPSRLTVEILARPDPNQDIGKLRPNPLTLVVSISPDLKLSLNGEDSGAVNDSAHLSARLQQIFQQRKEQHAYKGGSETRSDLPEDQRVEKTLTIKASRSIKYGDVIKVIDAVRGAGASPIVLQIDDLAR
jgi:biopolymer transport protein ExbD